VVFSYSQDVGTVFPAPLSETFMLVGGDRTDSSHGGKGSVVVSEWGISWG